MSGFTMVPLFRRDHHENLLPPFLTGRLFDQYFGAGLAEDDIHWPSSLHNYYIRPHRQIRRQASGLSEIATDPKKFQVMLDVNQFTPDEINVKTIDNCVLVLGKHEEKLDEHGYVAREFQRRYILPDNVVPESVTSSLSHDGILTIEAPRKMLEAPKANERLVPIMRKETPAVSQQAQGQNEEKK